ncbi:hypothetical protein PI124_g22810 [Phytophthora idaei]|nr:hypothetical protein PI126_g22352 [Phytophthora idaei]KAG3232100.1 hypothetical protein PI124_g22810 [Phytophthora idaei]
MARFRMKGKPVESITDDEILQFVRKHCQTLKNEYIPDIKTLFKGELRMDLAVDGCDTRVFQYFQDFSRIMGGEWVAGVDRSFRLVESWIQRPYEETLPSTGRDPPTCTPTGSDTAVDRV